MKNKLVTILVVVATLILAGIAVFTAIRLYQLRQKPVAPTAPESEPAALESTSCEVLSFTIQPPSGTATATPSATPTETATSAPTGTPSVTTAPTGTPTPPALPEAGTSWPTIVGLGVGILVIIGSILLAI